MDFSSCGLRFTDENLMYIGKSLNPLINLEKLELHFSHNELGYNE